MQAGVWNTDEATEPRPNIARLDFVREEWDLVFALGETEVLVQLLGCQDCDDVGIYKQSLSPRLICNIINSNSHLQTTRLRNYIKTSIIQQSYFKASVRNFKQSILKPLETTAKTVDQSKVSNLQPQSNKHIHQIHTTNAQKNKHAAPNSPLRRLHNCPARSSSTLLRHHRLARHHLSRSREARRPRSLQ